MPNDKTKGVERAEKLVAQGKASAAIAEYRTLLRETPNDLNIINRLGDLLVREGKTAEANELFGRAAQLYAEGGFFLKAIAIYKKILKLDPNVIEPRLRLADLYARRDLTSDARIEYQAVAEKLAREGNIVRAKDVYERLIKVEPGNVQARLALGDLLLTAGKKEQAIEELGVAARDLEQSGLVPEAAQIHRRILKMDLADMEAHAGAIRSLARLGFAQEAVAGAQGLRAKSPASREVIETLVEVLETSGRAAEAEVLVRSDLPNDARQPLARVVLGRVHLFDGRIAEGKAEIISGGRELLTSGRAAEAAAAADVLLKVDPSSKEGLELRLDTARALNDADLAAQLSERLVTQFGQVHRTPRVESPMPEAPAPAAPAPKAARPLSREDKEFLEEHLTEAEVFQKYGLLEKAIDPLKRVLLRFPDHLEAHKSLRSIFSEQGNRIRVVEHSLFIAEIHERNNRRDEARRILEEAQNLDPDNPVVVAWLARLSGRAGQEDAASALESTESGASASSESDPERAADGPRIDVIGEFRDSLVDALSNEPEIRRPAHEDEEPQGAEGAVAAFKAFREKIDQEVSGDDFKTRYDLAIAYKEMGLVDEAISEFEYLTRDASRFVECCAMLGLCYRQKGLPAQAERWYLAAIQAQDPDADRNLALRFELAETYLELGDFERAREGFRRVADVDGSYRNVAARLEDVAKMA